MSRFLFIATGMLLFAGIRLIIKRHLQPIDKVTVPVCFSGPVIDGLEVTKGAVMIR